QLYSSGESRVGSRYYNLPNLHVPLSPFLPVSLSLCLSVSLSPCPLVSPSPHSPFPIPHSPSSLSSTPVFSELYSFPSFPAAFSSAIAIRPILKGSRPLLKRPPRRE